MIYEVVFISFDSLKIKAERDKAEADKKSLTAKKEVKKETLDTLKPVRAGIGKYIKTEIL
jgi:hypothetical protein